MGRAGDPAHPPLRDALKRLHRIVTDQRTDLAPAERLQPAGHYLDPDRWNRERIRLKAEPHPVTYAGRLAEPGAWLVVNVVDAPVLLTRGTDRIHAFLNVCRHRGAPVAEGCGVDRRLSCPFHGWTYATDDGSLAGVPGRDGFPQLDDDTGLIELPVRDVHGIVWVHLDPAASIDSAEELLGPELSAEFASFGLETWDPVGERVLADAVNWKLGLDTFGETYHFATVHRDSFMAIAPSNLAAFDAFGPHARMLIPLHPIASDPVDLEACDPLEYFVCIYLLYPDTVLSVTRGNSEMFRVSPGDRPGTSVLHHQNAVTYRTGLTRAMAAEFFEYAHDTVRTEDWPLAVEVQRNLDAGVVQTLRFGRNEPALQHRHTGWDAWTEGATAAGA